MTTIKLIAILLLTLPTLTRADDTTIADQLKTLGAKITAKDGVVTQVVFTDCSKLADPEFRAIGQLIHLKTLTLYGKCHGLTDATSLHLANLKELETLGTDGAIFTDDGLKNLAALTNLRSASFFHTSFGVKGFTGVGFGHLKACEKLEKLTVAGISMGDEGFAAISTITQLRDFATWHTYQTEAANAHIAKLPLTKLNLGQRLPHAGAKDPSLSDASLATIAGIKTLESLKLGESHFTVAALQQLKSLPKLKQITFYETDLTQSEVDRLREDFKGVKIDFQPLTEEQRKKFDAYLKR